VNIIAKNIGRGRARVELLDADGKAAHVDTFELASARARERFAESVLDLYPATDPVALREQLLKLATDATADAGQAPGGEPADATADAEALECLASGDLADQVEADLRAVGIAADVELALLTYLSFTSRLLARPLSMLVQGPSSTGKSWTGERVARLIPEAGVLEAQHLTPKALAYAGELTRHAVVLMGEWARDEEQVENGTRTQLLRELMASGRIRTLTTNTDGGVGKLERLTAEGPVAVYASTTLAPSKVFDEDRNRFLVVHTDETPAATGAVLEHQARAYAGQGDDDGVVDRIVRRHHAMQRVLADVAGAGVVVPFAHAIQLELPRERPEIRRDFPKVLAAVQASALLHHVQRERTDSGAIVATEADYGLVYRLMSRYLVSGGPSPAALRVLKRMRDAQHALLTFTRTDVENLCELGKSAAHGVIRELSDAGAIAVAEMGSGPAPWRWRIVPTAELRRQVLPAPDVVFGDDQADDQADDQHHDQVDDRVDDRVQHDADLVDLEAAS
jgi:hypothetical protein